MMYPCTNVDLSPKIAWRRRFFSRRSFSPLGVTLPTRMSPSLTSTDHGIIPISSRSLRLLHQRLAIRVISSAQALYRVFLIRTLPRVNRCINVIFQDAHSAITASSGL